MNLFAALIAAAAIGGAYPSQDALPRKPSFGVQMTAAQGGVSLTTVFAGSTAEGAGLKPGDVITKVNGAAIAAPNQVMPALSALKLGDKFDIEYRRGDAEKKVSATLKERPRDKGANYEVIYDHVVTNGYRVRTMISKPTAPGKRPVFFVIQGLGNFSMDTPLFTGPYGKFLEAFNADGYVTVQVDKPGQGDSEGGATADVDFDRELDCYRQALKAVKRYPFVDPDRIYIFGHSMGGLFGPIVAAEEKVAGLAVYGTVCKTWTEYWLENVRRQDALGGMTWSQVHEHSQRLSAFIHYFVGEKKTPEEIVKLRPDLKATVDENSPDGKTWATRTFSFWWQLNSKNLPEIWSKVDSNVLAMWGENEWISTREDHPLIAEIVNLTHPGKGKFVLVESSDHGFFRSTSVKDSFTRYGRPGSEFNPRVIELLKQWIAEIEKR
jgi:pimeloyl-ACP methyl ester carboxylesterase